MWGRLSAVGAIGKTITTALPKRYIMVLLLVVVLVYMFYGKCLAYIMPAGQIIDLMTANFAKIKTLVVTQSVHLTNPQDQEEERVLEQKIWLKAPDLFRLEITDKPESQGMDSSNAATDQPDTDMAFRRLLMANNGMTIKNLLSKMGVNLESVAFARFDGIIVYRIGDKGPENPKLLIEKRRFLPLLLIYTLSGETGKKMVTVIFKDYSELDEGWYPDEIDYSIGKEVKKRYLAIDLQVNIPVEHPLSKISAHRFCHPDISDSSDEYSRYPNNTENSQGDLEEERLNEIIKALKEKYQ